ncbi:hypothetical protein VITU102760_24790 [Vibrio tubiashii]|uniref:Type IV pilus biogenesis protein PilP n=1 Tax=Vibrio tubiashii ATCC 19109 TaxID=1051646 RepID=F9T6T4_9VIBR|nr:hypothetical protein [Vibrio tubiashii]AIW17498.1 hypothetical protein IX91_25920 [Vibrio tubiashii ATCC 19109]EGU54489.1 hypothetical protein VITU9109_02907 [Vibrio tubiashii ATCC 19109]EIF05988.1 hypothetical protein VT1337_00575 [Vibrio tubiashii NCIMB 1337 = ATCC 19106]
MEIKKSLKIVGLALAMVSSLFVAWSAYSSKSLSNPPSKVVHKTDVVENLDYEMPGIVMDRDTAELISISKSIAMYKQKASLKLAEAEFNAAQELEKTNAESAQTVPSKATARLASTVVDSTEEVKKEVEQYEEGDRGAKPKTASRSKVEISVKSVLIPNGGIPTAIIAVNGGKHSLVKKGDRLEGMEITDISSGQISIFHKGKNRVVYVAQ